MAQFRAVVRGNRGNASRLGSKTSGMRATVNGWGLGVSVFARYEAANGGDVFYVYETGGSKGDQQKRLLGKVTSQGFLTPTPKEG